MNNPPLSIGQLGVIGNCRSAALVTGQGSVVWACLPDFDSPSVFAKILDEDIGGEFAIIPEDGAAVRQEYLGQTNILRTVFEGPSGSFEVIDFMPMERSADGSLCTPPEIYRLVRVLGGRPVLAVRYDPRLNYSQGETKSFPGERYLKSNTVSGDYHSVYLYTSFPQDRILGREPVTLDRDGFFLVSYHQKLAVLDLEVVARELEKTRKCWDDWVGRTAVFPRYQNAIIRSALALKLLTYRKTGAVIAAVTTSLPENPGGSRNWDYRYCWLRDASLIIQTLTQIRHSHTAREFLRFLLNNITDKADELQILYGIHGERDLKEITLDHLKGFRKSRPVRIGNDAYLQKQNDVYGVLMDLIYLSFTRFPDTLDHREALWTTVRYIMKTVEDNWQKPDRGIWEIRSEHRHFVFSKVLSWVAADRGVRIADLFQRPDYAEPWSRIRDAIRDDIEKKGWNENAAAYTQFYGSGEMDASLLLMEKMGYCSAEDARYVSTVKAIDRELGRDGLMYRYKNRDDFGKPESAFTICSFWMIESLYKIGERDEARSRFERMLESANPLGLFSEDMDFETRELLGNFPQGYSHLELINAAILLNGLEDGGPGPE